MSEMLEDNLEARVQELEQELERLKRPTRRPSGREWKSDTTIWGIPLVHVAYGRDENGKLRVAKGIIAIGQFAIGGITIAQFGIGFLFGFGQFVLAPLAIGQFAFALAAIGQFAITWLFGLGQFATGYVAVGQVAFGEWVLGQGGWGSHMWTTVRKDPEAVAFFKGIASLIGF